MKQNIRPFVDFERQFYFKNMNIKNEIWKDVVNYEGIYKISNFGRLKSVNRVRSNSNAIIKERILKLMIGKNGSVRATLYSNSVPKLKEVHQLVAESFLNHTPCGYDFVINHKDFDRQNNNVTNLEIITQRENANKKHLKSTSNYVGVCWNKLRNKWKAQIRINGKQKYLGLFNTEIEAYNAYKKELNLIK